MAIAELVVKLIGDISGFSKTMGQVGRDIKKTGGMVTSAGKSFTSGLSLPLAGIGTASLMMAGQFEASMSKVKALGDNISGQTFENLKNQALKLGAETQFSAKQAADGMGEFAAAGFKADEIAAAMAGTLDLAAAAQIDVGQAANITQVTLGQFSLKADQAGNVADTLAKAAASGSLTIQDLAESLKYVGPVASRMGISLDEVSASLSLLSNMGIKGEQAGTSLRMGLARMAGQTKPVIDVTEKYGLSLVDANGKVKSMLDIIEQLNKKQVSFSDLTKLVGINAVTAWSAMQTAGGGALDEMTKKVQDHAGAAKEMATILNDNLKGSFERMGGSIETLGIILGTILTPAARAVMGVIEELANKGSELLLWFKDLNPNIKNATIAFLSIVTIAGPVILAIGKMISIVGLVTKTIWTANTAVAFFASASGVGLILVAVAAATAALVYFKDDLGGIFEGAAKIVGGFYDRFVEVFTQIKNSVWPTIGPIVGFFVRLVAEIGTVLKEVAGVAFDLFTEILGMASSFVVSVIEVVSKILDWASDFTIFFGKAFILAFTAITDAAINLTVEVLKIFAGLFEGITTLVSEGMGIILNYFGITANDIISVWNTMLGYVKSAFLATVEGIIWSLDKLQKAAGIVSETAAAAIGDLKQSLEDLKKPSEVATIEIKKTEGAVVDLSKATKDQEKKIADLKDAKKVDVVETKKQKDATDKHTEALGGATGATDKHTKSTKKKSDADKEAEKAQKAHEKSVNEFAGDLEKLVSGSDAYNKILADQKKGSIDATQAGDKLKDLYNKGRDALKEYNSAQEDYEKLMLGMANGENPPADKIGEITKRAEEAKKGLEDLSGTKVKIGEDQDFSKQMEDLGKNLTNALATSVGDALSTALSGGSVRKQLGSMGASLGQTAGAAFGGAFAGPFGAAIGGALGGSLGEHVGEGIKDFGKSSGGTYKALITYLEMVPVLSMFAVAFDQILGDKFGGAKSEGTATRRGLDKWLNEQFAASHIQLVVDGQMQQIKDFDFGGGQFGSPDGPAGKYFSGLDETVKNSFSGIGVAFSQLAGISSEYSEAIAMVLADNIGGSLNNLQVMVGGLGLNFEEMQKIVVKSMLDGKLSFLDAQKALTGIAQIAQNGIPDAIGATVTAFQNLKDAGIKGGRYATDAIKDIAYEAKELGIRTFPDLMKNLLASGKFTGEEIDQVFSALSSSGIDSIEKLTNATDEQLIGVLAKLQQQEFPFADATRDAKGMVDEIGKLDGKNVDVTFNLKTNLDDNTKKAMDAGLVPKNGSNVTARSTVTPSAKGNVFSAGSVVPFAKGGVVSDFKMFDIGMMAERGPEAIVPLTRMSNGDLGIQNAGGGGGGDVNIEINAPYAMPGVAETIRREIEKVLDTKNRRPGIRS